MSELKHLPIGIEDFKRIIEDNCYFVDKSLMIKELISDKSIVKLFTRPRRFGKTLNMSMIQYFFENTHEKNEYLFKNLKISEFPKYMEYQGKYPVISITLKDMRFDTFEDAYNEFSILMAREFARHDYILQSDMISEQDKEDFRLILSRKADRVICQGAIRLLSDCLKKHWKENVIILIDEYDVPLDSAYDHGYYDKMVSFIRTAFSSALKTNFSLKTAILTGCLRISKESIFTGLNNLQIYSVMNDKYSSFFGFTDNELSALIDYYGISGKKEEIKKYYDGYTFGNTEIYNSWSVVKYIDSLLNNERHLGIAYWSNTSSNNIIKQLIKESNEETKAFVEDLMNDIPIRSVVYEDITYSQLNINTDYIWSFLLFTGYLKIIDSQKDDDGEIICRLGIPNLEIRSIYKNTIMQWFKEQVKSVRRDDFFASVIEKNAEEVNKHIQYWLAETISFYDEKESYYHGFLAGLLTGFNGYVVTSNRESGNGRYDLFVKTRVGRNTAVIFEFKIAPTEDELEKYADIAIDQIEEKKYEMELRNERYRNIIKYGIAFCQKVCYTKLSEYSD